ncbi:hypothetical protein GCM10009579_82800 [Streptomyces javensis]|uniref:DUF397 domain-containing protein n=1 Tax=Streptomyces javensis TaxID=114698 RepID=A0ABP4I677_9ACTN
MSTAERGKKNTASCPTEIPRYLVATDRGSGKGDGGWGMGAPGRGLVTVAFTPSHRAASDFATSPRASK